jgi:hypothetical protein
MRLDVEHRVGGTREFIELRSTRLAVERLAAAFERLAAVAERVVTEVPAALHEEITEAGQVATAVETEINRQAG